MSYKNWLMVVVSLLGIISFSISAKIGCVNPFNTNDSGSSMLPILSGQVTSPNPSDGATNIPITTTLTWATVISATSYDVYFATTTTGWSLITNTVIASYALSPLLYATTYYWRVDSKNSYGTTTGNVWSFTTALTLSAVDDYVWVANYYSNNVTRIQKSTSITTTIAVGNSPIGVAVDETYCWVAITSSNNVTRILKSNPAITTTIAVGISPRAVAVDETYIWVANRGSNNVIRIKKSDLTTTNIAVGTMPGGVAVDGTYVWVANEYSDNVTRIQKSDLSTTTIAVGDGPFSLGDMTGYAYDNYAK